MQKKEIYLRCAKKPFKPAYVAEVGVYLPETSMVLDFINDGCEALLVDADPGYVQKIREYFSGNSRVKIVNKAVSDTEGSVELYHCASSTFIGGHDTPAVVNDGYVPSDKDSFVVDSCRFASLDNGRIDLAVIDVEGSEWFVLKHMVSRPAVISIETHGKYYLNPFLKEIRNWMKTNNYAVWFKDKSDSVYARKDILKVSLAERSRLAFYNAALCFRRMTRYFRPQRRVAKPA